MHTQHIANAIWHPELLTDSTLHVIAVVTNPMRYHARYRIFRRWAEAMRATPHVQLHVAEAAFGDRHHELASPANPADLALRATQEIWHKENLINLAEKRLLPRNWRYLAWIDGDVWFEQPDWALETIHELQHYPVVQPWSECTDLGHRGEVLSTFTSFAKLAQRGMKMRPPGSASPYTFGHPGFAWACRRDFWESVGGLVDFAILGSADTHMAWAMIGRVGESFSVPYTPGYQSALRAWERNAVRATNGCIGMVPGLIKHAFHGPKDARAYTARWQILVKHQYDPAEDLRRDHQGLVYLHSKPQLLDAIRRYMRARNEDSTG